MNVRLVVAATGLAALTTLGLSACSSNSDTPPAPASSAAASAAPASSAATSAAPSASMQNESTEPSMEASAEGDNG